MDAKIQRKIEAYRKMANTQSDKSECPSPRSGQSDSLSMVIRSQKEADDFIAELESAFKRAR